MVERAVHSTEAPNGYTVLTALGGKRLAKRFRQIGDGPIEVDDYDNAYEFSARAEIVETPRDLYHRLAELQDDPFSCIVRGAIAEGANRAKMLRRATERNGEAPTLRDVTRVVATFDGDIQLTDEEAQRVQVVTDPDGAVDFALSLTPPAFRACDLVWSFGASAGISQRKLSLHFAAFLDRPVLGSELKAIVEKWNADAGRTLFDSSIYGAQSIVYTARPVFEGDALDPLDGCRIGFRDGNGRPLALPRIGATPTPAPAGTIEAPEDIALALVAELCGRGFSEMLAGKRTRQDICSGIFVQLRDCGVRPEMARGAARALCKAGNDPDVLKVHGGRRKPLSWFQDFVPSIYGTAPRAPRPDVAEAIRAACDAEPLYFTPAENLRSRRPLGPAVPTGLPTLDEFLEGGLRPCHAVLVGPPESGKTSFAAHLAARHLDSSPNAQLLVYVRDEDPGAFVNRLAQRVGFDRAALRQNDPETCKAAAEALEARWGDRIQMLDPYASPLDVARLKAAEMRAKGPLLVLVDSLQVAVTEAGSRAASQKDRIDAAMGFGSELASHGDLVLSLSQSSRAGYADPKNGRDPRAEGSGSAGIEFNADLLLGFKSKADDDPTAPRTVTVLKGRGGLGKGTVSFVIDRGTAIVREVDRSAADEAEQHAAAAKLRPYQEAVLAELRKAAAEGKKRSKNYLEGHVPGGTSQIRAALKRLVVSGEVFVEEGPRRSLDYYLPTSPHLAPPRLDLASGDVADDAPDDFASSPPPLGEAKSERRGRPHPTRTESTPPAPLPARRGQSAPEAA